MKLRQARKIVRNGIWNYNDTTSHKAIKVLNRHYFRQNKETLLEYIRIFREYDVSEPLSRNCRLKINKENGKE